MARRMAWLKWLAPAMFASARDIGDALKSATRSASGHLGARRFRSILVIAEVSLSVLLLVGAGLLVRTMVKMQRADIGFEGPDNEVTIVTAREERHVARASKAEVARAILDVVGELRKVERTPA